MGFGGPSPTITSQNGGAPVKTSGRIRSGIGIYPQPVAARLLRLSSGRLRRWVGGYTYWMRESSSGRVRRQQRPVIQTDLPPVDGRVALSFLELMELRVVKAIVDRGLPLQRVRVAADLARSRFSTEHPFASRRVFTDGEAIFSAINDDPAAPDVVKWTRAEIDQVVSGGVLQQFLNEIDFDEKSSLAYRWWPLGRTVPVMLDPNVGFGAPVVEGTGVRTSVVARLARVSSVDEAAIAYELTRDSVEAALEFEGALLSA